MNHVATFSKLGIARTQLERAIVLMLDEKDYVSAITLAGASEEILGSLLRAQGKRSSYDYMKEGFEKIFQLFHGHLPQAQSFNNLANGVRNGLKHFSDGADLKFNPEEAAAEILDRAVSNLFKLTSEETSNMERFKHYHMNRGKA